MAFFWYFVPKSTGDVSRLIKKSYGSGSLEQPFLLDAALSSPPAYRYPIWIECFRRWLRLDDDHLNNGHVDLHLGGVLYLKFAQLMIVMMVICSLWSLLVLIPVYINGANEGRSGFTTLQRVSIANLQQGSSMYCTSINNCGKDNLCMRACACACACVSACDCCTQHIFGFLVLVKFILSSCFGVPLCERSNFTISSHFACCHFTDVTLSSGIIFVWGFFVLAWHFATDIQSYVTRTREQRRQQSSIHDKLLASGGAANGQTTHVVEISKLPASLISSSVLQRVILEQVFGDKISSPDNSPPIVFTHIALDINSIEQLLSQHNAIVAQLETCRAEIELFDEEARHAQRSLDYTSLSKTPRRLSNADPLDTRCFIMLVKARRPSITTINLSACV
jgi:hypothetical protein